MKHWMSTPLVALLLIPAGNPSQAASEVARSERYRTPVMIVGTVHLDNPMRDRHEFKIEDIMSDGRQAEIRDLVARLARFRPTRIGVEVPATPEHDERFQPNSRNHSAYVNHYRSFLKGERGLTRSEVDQIAFRLGKAVGLERIHGVNALYRYNESAVHDYAEKHQQSSYGEEADRLSMETGMELFRRLAGGTLPEFYTWANSPEHQLRLQETYVPLVGIGEGDDYPGADLLGDWYVRNVRIFRNIMHLSGRDERIVILIGLGHAYYLRQLVRESPDHELVEVSDFLLETQPGD